MKKTVILAIVAFITATGCKEDVEKSASRHLDNAREAFSELNYSLAKQEIDSILLCRCDDPRLPLHIYREKRLKR